MKNIQMIIWIGIVLLAFTVSFASSRDSGTSRRLSGTSYARFLDGTVLAQYNFADEVAVVRHSPLGSDGRQSTSPGFHAVSMVDPPLPAMVVISDYRGAQLWSGSIEQSTELESVLEQFRGRLVVIVTRSSSGSYQSRLHW